MSTLKYVCVSDLHLGADYSLMSRMNPDGRVDLLRPAATLAALGRALRETVRGLSGPELPTLILLGDVLDLGQSPFGEVAQGFKRFVEVMFPPDEPPVFSNQLLTVPGNHDHHLWRTAQDRFFLQHLSAYRDAKFIPDLIEHTPLFAPGDLSCDLMTQVMQGYAHLSDARVRIAYPNLGLIDAERARCVVLHHGHYIDATYRLMSSINSAFRGGAGRPETVARIEAENGAWVDFLFSDMGSVGVVGKDIDTLYQMLRDAAASHRFSQQLSDALLAKLSSAFGIGGDTRIPLGSGGDTKSPFGITVANVLKALVDVTLLRGAQSERDTYASVMTADGVSDLRWYLGGPVRRQIGEAGHLRAARDMSFVFGHTHKPFQDQLAVEGFKQPVAIYNTGGWVMDQPTMTAAQGAAAILIDEQLNLGSLRLFNDAQNGKMTPVHAAGVGGFRDADNPLLENLDAVIGQTRPLWDEFTAAARGATELHASVLLQAFFTPGALQ